MVLILKGKSFVGLIICLYKIKSKKYIALQIDKALKIEKQKYNVMFLREQFNQSFLWKIGRWCYPLWEKQKVLFQKLNTLVENTNLLKKFFIYQIKFIKFY